MGKWVVTFAVCLVMVGSLATFADAGKPSSSPPFSVPPDGSAVAAAGQAFGLCATGVATALTACLATAGSDTNAIAACGAAAAADAQACQQTFFTTLSTSIHQ
jgi:hypothetical protein